MRLDGVVGALQSALGSGVERQLRLGKDGEIVIGGAAKYLEAVRRGSCYRGQTAVTGVAPGTAIGTTAAFTLYNPLKSGKDLVLLELSMGYISGTLGAGAVMLCTNTDTTEAAPTGTAITARNARLGMAAGSMATALTTATLASSPSVIGPFCSLGASLASTAVAPWQIVRDINGGIVVGEGGALSLEGVAAAGSTPLVVFGALWEEIPN